jgi:hypothetical protein
MRYPDISATDMLAVIGRARLAERTHPPEKIIGELNQLSPVQIITEFHRAVAVLNKFNALSSSEQYTLNHYAEEYLRSSYAGAA